MKKLVCMLSTCALVAAAAPAAAHHSAAAFDTQKQTSVTGKVVEYRYMNPHIYLTLEVTRGDGTKQRMEVEAGAASVLNALGFTRDKLKVGDIVTIAGSPSRRVGRQYEHRENHRGESGHSSKITHRREAYRVSRLISSSRALRVSPFGATIPL